MNKLSSTERARILHLLCEGQSIRATTRLTGASKDAVVRLLCWAGRACAAYQDRVFNNLPCKRLQVDEVWTFTFCKEQNRAEAKNPPRHAGDTWTWTAICADTKLVPSWYVGNRDAEAARLFIYDLAPRLANRVQVTSDGHHAYVNAVREGFRGDVDYAQLIKTYGPSLEGERRYSPPACNGAKKKPRIGSPDQKHISTSYAERQNLTMRMQMRRFTRLTNGFSKKVENHAHAVALHFMYYNFVRIHKTLRVTPAMAAGVTDRLWEIGDIVKVLEEWEGNHHKFNRLYQARLVRFRP